MARRRNRNRAAARRGPRTIWNAYRHKGVSSIVICLILWIIYCVAAWFLIGEKMGYYSGELDNYLKDIYSDERWKRTIINGIIQFLLMIWPMCEYLFVFHRPVGLKDRYKWYVPFIVMICITLAVVILVNALTLTLGWLTLVQILLAMAVIMIPRFAFPPR
ncbi:MAG: hypothetical protein IJN57_03090 [Oscillospiraceae bacterium]|nr:hypothetical protein [Oscillospiraceae bacterium]